MHPRTTTTIIAVLFAAGLTTHAPADTPRGKPGHIDQTSTRHTALLTTTASASTTLGLARPRDTDTDEIKSHLYDLRDLRAAMPGQDFSSFLDDTAQDQLVIREVAPGLVLVRGRAEAIHGFEAITDLATTASLERDTVEIRLLRIPAEDIPSVGAEAPENAELLASATNVIRRGRHAAFNAIEQESYIKSWGPVVADSSVGYDATIDTAERGFRATLATATAQTDDGPRLIIHFQGEALDTSIQTVEHDINGALLSIGLPKTQTRTFESTIELDSTHTTVIGTTLGFDPDTALVVTARITPATR